MTFQKKETYTMEDLLTIMKLLRAENGCPWDREQTHESIRKNFIEEVYEACEAIDLKDVALLKEELGDVLLQVVFHAQMCEEAAEFDFGAVADGICKKLIVRHPHIFSDVVASTSEQVLKNWDAIKKSQKGQTAADTLSSVPKTLPALMRSEKLGHRAARAGMDYTDEAQAFRHLTKEVNELHEALVKQQQDEIEEELGDVLFSAVNVARLTHLDAEQSLTKACDKFTARFTKTEQLIKQDGKTMESLSAGELDSYWEQAKKQV